MYIINNQIMNNTYIVFYEEENEKGDKQCTLSLTSVIPQKISIVIPFSNVKEYVFFNDIYNMFYDINSAKPSLIIPLKYPYENIIKFIDYITTRSEYTKLNTKSKSRSRSKTKGELKNRIEYGSTKKKVYEIYTTDDYDLSEFIGSTDYSLMILSYLIKHQNSISECIDVLNLIIQSNRIHLYTEEVLQFLTEYILSNPILMVKDLVDLSNRDEMNKIRNHLTKSKVDLKILDESLKREAEKRKSLKRITKKDTEDTAQTTLDDIFNRIDLNDLKSILKNYVILDHRIGTYIYIRLIKVASERLGIEIMQYTTFIDINNYFCREIINTYINNTLNSTNKSIDKIESSVCTLLSTVFNISSKLDTIPMDIRKRGALQKFKPKKHKHRDGIEGLPGLNYRRGYQGIYEIDRFHSDYKGPTGFHDTTKYICKGYKNKY